MLKKIGIASDHAGFKLKEEIINFLKEKKYEIEDLGTFNGDESVDYPDFACKVAEGIRKKKFKKGILICGTGIGMAIMANRYKEVRAANCHEIYTARLAREHNDANVLALAAKRTPEKLMLKILEIWLSTDFDGGRHQRRIEKITEIERGETGIEN